MPAHTCTLHTRFFARQPLGKIPPVEKEMRVDLDE